MAAGSQRIGLIEGGPPEGFRIAKDLGDVEAAVPGGFLRGILGITRDCEAALRIEAAKRGASHVVETRIRVAPGWFRTTANGKGRAVIIEAAEE